MRGGVHGSDPNDAARAERAAGVRYTRLPMPTAETIPAAPRDVEDLEERLSRPTPEVVADLAAVDGDIMLLGVGGKMGPTLARMARRAAPDRRILAVARFSDPAVATALRRMASSRSAPICSIARRSRACRASRTCPDGRPQVRHQDAPSRTWATNTFLPVLSRRRGRSRDRGVLDRQRLPVVRRRAERARTSRSAGAVGDYAASCLGRERMSLYSETRGTPGLIFRLNYAIDLRYGVLHDVARRCAAGSRST